MRPEQSCRPFGAAPTPAIIILEVEMEFFVDLAGFSIKAIIIVVAVAAVLGLASGLLFRHGREKDSQGAIRVTHMNQTFDAMALSIKRSVLSKKAFKGEVKKTRTRRRRVPDERPPKRVFVLDFRGDLAATAAVNLRHQVNALLQTLGSEDEVVVRLESAGGKANAYGFAASQLKRIKDHGHTLTVCVDRIAASGGYMMASVADRILAAPFALVGSIGVLAMVPNLHRFLRRHDIDYEEITAGEYKRPMSFLAENTAKGREKFIEDLEDFHAHFKEFVVKHRPEIPIDEVATGEVWFGDQAVARKLVDDLRCSDDYLLAAAADADVYKIEYQEPKSLRKKLSHVLADSADSMAARIWDRLTGTAMF